MIKQTIKNIYKGVCKRDLSLLLAEQEYRFNHRYTGRHFMEKIARYIRQFVPMTNQAIGNALDSYNARFVLLTKLTERSSLSDIIKRLDKVINITKKEITISPMGPRLFPFQINYKALKKNCNILIEMVERW